jgi:hypothetical protein
MKKAVIVLALSFAGRAVRLHKKISDPVPQRGCVWQAYDKLQNHCI